MSGKPDFRNYINPQPRGRFSAAWQSESLPDGTMYVEDKGGKIIDGLIKSVRPGSIVCVRRLFCLAPWTGKPGQRRKAMASRLDAIKERGGCVLETETQRRSDAKGQCSQMLMAGYEDIATAGRALPKGLMGRPAREYTKDQIDAMRQIWFSRRYRTRKEAVAAIQSLGIKVTGPHLYQRFGKPDRSHATVAEALTFIPPPMKQRRRAPALVYFIKSGNAVKIGHSHNPKKRMRDMAVSHHGELKLLATIPGGRTKESVLHRKFKKHRIKGEWFHLVPEIAKYIASVKRRGKSRTR